MFTPRNLRRRGVSRSGSRDATKGLAFRRAAAVSKRFIHQSASMLESSRINPHYLKYCALVDKGGLRK